jgi:hypothetical protein
MVVRLTPVGLSRQVQVATVDPLPGKVNYFLGNDPKKWRTNLPTYRGVLYREAYPGIDLKFYGNGRQVEYDIIVKPGADPNRVQFRYAGIKGLEVTPEGDLALLLPDGGQLLQKKPVVYQEIAGARVAREGRFRLQRHGARLVCGFAVAAYDRRHPSSSTRCWSIPPIWGAWWDMAHSIAVDSAGCAYIAGETDSATSPPRIPTRDTRRVGMPLSPN